MKAILWSALLVAVFAAPAAAEKFDVIWLAVGPEELTAPLAPLIERRKADGYVVHVAKPPVADAIKALGRTPSVLLIVGDYVHGKPAESWTVPPMRRELYKWRKPQRAEFSSDSLYGDTDGDLVPDIPVGRIPARTPEQVKRVVEKTLAYEEQAVSIDDLRILAWAGAPGYGGAIDAMATGMLVSTVRNFAPAWSDRYFISAAAGNDLCGWPPDQPARFNEQWSKGAVLAAFVAHASDSHVYSMRHEGKSIRYGPTDARAMSGVPKPVAPVLFLTCYSGEFDDDDECLGETLLFLPGGPPAVIAATTESHPLPNLFAGRAMLKQMSGGAVRLGRTWTHAQQKAVRMKDFLMEGMLRDVEGKLEPKIDVAKLRRDSPLMYAILGDPALHLKMALPLEVNVVQNATTAKENFVVSKPKGATRLTVGWRAKPKPGKPPVPGEMPDAETAKRLLAEANAREAFQTVAVLQADEDWVHEPAKPGQYRFIAHCGPRLAAAVMNAD